MNPGILYISYDGMLEPLGQSQVLAYLEKLASGHQIHLISFEKPNDWADQSRRDALAARLAAAAIRWHPLRYHQSPSAPATAYDIAVGAARALAIARTHRLSVVHARSYVAGTMALAVKRALGARFLFDMRGFWADERVDGGLWPRGGALYRAAKSLERRLLLTADHVVTLTEASIHELRRFDYLRERLPPVTVIPTCADLDRFAIQGPLQRTPFVLGHIGAVGTWYLLDEMFRVFAALRHQVPGSRLLIANRGEHDLIGQAAERYGVRAIEMELIAVTHDEVPAVIGRMTAGMAIIKPAYSKIASAPTKLAEYLGCGVPCLGNAGVGDVERILEDRRVGVALPGFSAGEIETGVRRLVELVEHPDIQQRCRAAAGDLFSLDEGVARYDAIYRLLGHEAA